MGTNDGHDEAGRRWRSRVGAAFVAVVAAAAVVATTMVAGASTDRSPRPAAGGWVGVLTYSLGDSALRVAEIRAEEEAGAVHSLLGAWPSRPGVAPTPGYRGYDYLGEALAAKGFVVVAVSANGVDAGPLGHLGDLARARVGNEHLRLWRDLAAGAGALPTSLRDARTGKPVVSPPAGISTWTGSADGALARRPWRDVAGRRVARRSGASRGADPGRDGAGRPGAGGDRSVRSGSGGDGRLPLHPDSGPGLERQLRLLRQGRMGLAARPCRAPIHRLLVHGANHNFSNTRGAGS